VQLPEIVADIKDAFRWLHEQAPELGIDTERVVVSGGSAGGYLTMGAGIWVEPRPTALVAYWGYGDVDGDWYTKPSEFYRTAVPLIGEEEANGGVRKRVLAGVTDPTESQARSRYYLYLRQNGLWTREVTGFDPATDKEKLDPYCPVRNITEQYPPILMIHGTEDTDVPYQLSAEMAVELTRHKVSHLLITVPFAGHGLSGGDRIINDTAHDTALSFIRAHLGDR
jgi:dipeptidyl aminopeptidase/acylaminoacyl peptidase